jgi:hypothetical protein
MRCGASRGSRTRRPSWRSGSLCSPTTPSCSRSWCTPRRCPRRRCGGRRPRRLWEQRVVTSAADGTHRLWEWGGQHRGDDGGGAVASWGWGCGARRASCLAMSGRPKIKIGEGKEKMTWRGGTHELGRRIGKLLEQIFFLGVKIFFLHPRYLCLGNEIYSSY